MPVESPAQILAKLRDGRPIIGSSAQPNPSGVLRDEASRSCIEEIKKGVNRASSSPGHVSVYRLYGTAGIGKSQTLFRAYNEIRNTVHGEKTAVALVNVETAGGDAGLQRRIVLNTVTAGQSQSELDTFAAKLAKRGDAGTADYIGFGVDVVFGIATQSPIGPGLLAAKGFKQALNLYRLSEFRLRSKIKERFPNETQLTELLVKWLAYLMQPTSKKLAAFEEVMNSYAYSGDLLDLFCQALKKAGYKCLIIVLDEVVQDDMSMLKLIWENPDGATRKHMHDLGRVMVCASVDNIWNEIHPQSPLGRRLMSTPGGEHALRGPRVEATIDGFDDYTHASRKLAELGQMTGDSEDWKDDSEIDEEAIRGELNTTADLTWNHLWSHLIKVREA